MNPRRIPLVLLSLVLLAGTGIASASRLTRPESGTKMWLTISEKTRLYYRLEKERSMPLELKGPADLKCLVRVIPADTLDREIDYRIVVTDRGKVIKTVDTTSTPSGLRWRDSGEIAAHSRKFSLRLGLGNHHLEFRLEGDEAAAAGVRFLVSTPSKSSDQSPLYPVDMADALTIVVNEKLRNYFLATGDQPVVVEVIGPTHLRIVSRLVYLERDKGTRTYGLTISGLQDEVLSRSLSTSKSLVAECQNHTDWNLGRARSFVLSIPKGRHRLVVRPSAPHHLVALRFTVPKASVTP